ncbi:hypothetical protein EN851_03370 [Mesorhizobium sp. M8A.F.Ca.ET.208.01.1.1]|uniref:hypothetical protein n=1 Tax=unclassified Mesorhizobium TaxID=325217 RepID=UPI001093CCAC|nr:MULTISPECIES: hypothetical protein [unclassified Mesorhizobium]TGQ94609.1 hypothetical protein EN851_03370 [Mesorhizobium sp. M8A.F.Ca.ET.208.01.1.1]TGT55097.1 hypothetical protein EN810_03370 [Mesorhizobium sp. M8A.F.Ca.ET.167.01.1.1]
MSEPRTVTNTALDKLPLFASDLEIAIAIVGKKYASLWKRDALPILERSGFPRFDALHQGRPIPQVRQFYARYLGIAQGFVIAPPPDGKEKVWVPKRERKKLEAEQRQAANVDAANDQP